MDTTLGAVIDIHGNIICPLADSDTALMIVPKPKHVVVNNIIIEQLQPDRLHENWEWLRRGALDILDKIRPHSEWIVEDLYAALRFPGASSTVLWICSRNSKALGWIAGQIQLTQYGKKEFFVWDAWTIPLAEREERDDVEGAREQMVTYVRIWAKGQGCYRISTLSARRLEYLGWTKGHTVYYLTL